MYLLIYSYMRYTILILLVYSSYDCLLSKIIFRKINLKVSVNTF